jgi:RNA polymerase-interacting CarD/CdnL/TRCF family regulator
MSITFESGGEKTTYFDLDLAREEMAGRMPRFRVVRMAFRKFVGTSSMSIQLETRSGRPWRISANGAESVSFVCDLLDER